MGIEFRARAVVLTTGTFLGGKIHIGLTNYQGGRAGDPPSNKLAARLRELPFRVGRLKTGTPPRLNGRTIDYSVLQAQPGDEPTPVFSFMGSRDEHPRQHRDVEVGVVIHAYFAFAVIEPMQAASILGDGPSP